MNWSSFQVMGMSLLISSCSAISTISSEERLAVLDRGKQVFDTYCASCHGLALRGTEIGPPLIWDLYVSGHHSDRQFKKAIVQGVKQHHWRFGDMPSFKLKDEEVADVVVYVRQTLRDNGIR